MLNPLRLLPNPLPTRSQEVPAFLQSLTSASGQRALAAPALLADAQKRQVASSQLVLPLEDMEAAFWGAGKGPGGDMRAALEVARAPEAFAGQPRVRRDERGVHVWQCRRMRGAADTQLLC